MLDLKFESISEDIGTLKQQLYGLGATQIATYDDIANKFFRATVKEWTGDKVRTLHPSFIVSR